jgi:glycosyltransferase involved in cell wall biosynthesis
MPKEIQKKPLVSFVLVAYNQEKYIKQAIEGAISQSYSPLQIILSDDCSSDKTYEIMENMTKKYIGSHQIILNKNVKNLGVGNHINRIMELADGDWIVSAAGDDISMPERTEQIIEAVLQSDGKAMSVWSRAQHMSEAGELLNKFETSNGKQYSANEIIFNKRVVMGCSHAWNKDIFKIFGQLHHSVMFEDNALSFRSYLTGQIVYLDKTLVHYRQHASNITNYLVGTDRRANLKRMNNRRYYAVIGIYQRLLDLMRYERENNNFKWHLKWLAFLLFLQLFKQKIKLAIMLMVEKFFLKKTI